VLLIVKLVLGTGGGSWTREIASHESLTNFYWLWPANPAGFFRLSTVVEVKKWQAVQGEEGRVVNRLGG